MALSCVAKHNAELAQSVVDAGAVGLLVLCVQEPELTLKRISATALSEIAKHTEELAQAVVDQGAVPYLAALISHPDAQLKRYVCQCLAQIAKHTVDLAEVVVEAEIFPRIFNCLKDIDVQVRKNAATCIREIAKQTTELAKLIVHSGGAAATVDYISESKGNARLPGIMTLGYISAFDDSLAMAVIVSKGIAPLKDALIHEPEDHIKAAAAWSLGQIGRHSPEHAKYLAEADVPARLLAVYMMQEGQGSTDLKDKSKKALKNIIQMCTHLSSLEPLLILAPNNILTYVTAQFAKVLPQNTEQKKTFIKSGGFQRIQEIEAAPGSKLRENIDAINSHFPEKVVQYYSPGFAESLIQNLDDGE